MPVAVILGAPLYSNAAGIIPMVQALMEKGAALGTMLAFMMSVIAISFPETVILRKVLKPKLIAVFVGVVAVGITIVGYHLQLDYVMVFSGAVRAGTAEDRPGKYGDCISAMPDEDHHPDFPGPVPGRHHRPESRHRRGKILAGTS